MISFIDLAAQRRRIHSNLEDGLVCIHDHGKYISGPEVRELEMRLARMAGTDHCISCGNGTDALQIALMAVGVGPGDEVITPAFSYIATAEAAKVIGAKPVYADIDPATYNIDPVSFEAKITNKTKAVIPVSLYGQCADFEQINEIAEKNGITVIEDGAQSFGASRNGKMSGNLSAIGCTSFFPTKPLGCYGDGGALFTNDANLAATIRQIASHGQDRRYHHIRVGINSRLDTVQASVLLAKLTIFHDEIQARQKVAKALSLKLQGCAGICTPQVEQGNEHVWAQYTIRVKNRDAVMAYLKQQGVPSVVHYPLPLHHQPAVADCCVTLFESEYAAEEVLSLPVHAYLSDGEIAHIANSVIDGVALNSQ
ncbi:MAG: DegT/DnrJ/EryC1/StrS family aminotransferase [Gammaproteobacteria bacterium]